MGEDPLTLAIILTHSNATRRASSRTRSRDDAKSMGEDPLTPAIISIRFNATRRASQSNPQPVRCQVNGGKPLDTCNYLNSFQCDAKSVPVEHSAVTTPSQWGKTP
ncbi:tubulin binding [Sesbania bispinosa]|nr:tubulin binding [Sesbania bispinosa]